MTATFPTKTLPRFRPYKKPCGAFVRIAGACVLILFGLAKKSDAQNWPDERRVGTIHYHADFSLNHHESIVRETAMLAEQIPDHLRLRRGEDTVRVFIFHDQSTFRAYVHQYFPDAPLRRALYIKPRGPGLVFAFDSKDLNEDLRHETTHAILHTMLPLVPLWLDEGLGEYFEVPDSQRFAGHAHLPQVRREVLRRGISSLRELESRAELTQMDAKAYRDSWAWVHFLLHGPHSVRKEFQSYLNDIQSHVPPGSLADRLARCVPEWNELFVQHFQSLDNQPIGLRQAAINP